MKLPLFSINIVCCGRLEQFYRGLVMNNLILCEVRSFITYIFPRRNIFGHIEAACKLLASSLQAAVKMKAAQVSTLLAREAMLASQELLS